MSGFGKNTQLAIVDGQFFPIYDVVFSVDHDLTQLPVSRMDSRPKLRKGDETATLKAKTPRQIQYRGPRSGTVFIFTDNRRIELSDIISVEYGMQRVEEGNVFYSIEMSGTDWRQTER